MTNMSDVQKKIEQLRAEIAELEAEQARAAQIRESMESAHQSLISALESTGIRFDDYVNAHAGVYRKALNKPVGGTTRRGRASTKSKVKIPAGDYGNIPSQPGETFTVKEKGPRPKAVREYAEEVGVDAFMTRCRLD